MNQLYWGINIGSESHHIIVIDENEKIYYDGNVPHQLEALTQSIERFQGLEKSEKRTLTFVIEGKNGYSAPFDRLLMDTKKFIVTWFLPNNRQSYSIVLPAVA